MSVDVTVDADPAEGFLVKLQSEAWEVNVRVPASEMTQLRTIRDASWDDRRAIRAGESAASPAFWAFDENGVTLLIGHDDETWDVAFLFPVEVVDEIVKAADHAK